MRPPPGEPPVELSSLRKAKNATSSETSLTARRSRNRLSLHRPANEFWSLRQRQNVGAAIGQHLELATVRHLDRRQAGKSQFISFGGTVERY